MTAAGWHPDPSGQPGLRYYDGQRWTEHFTPTPPPMPQVNVAVSTGGGGVNHALHAVLTFVTCGLWLPIWILCALFGGRSGPTTIAGNGNVVNRSRIPLIAGGVWLGMIALGLCVEHPWLFAIVLPIGAGVGLFFWKRNEDEKQRRLAAHADYQNQLYNEGDPRGTYGQFPPPPPFPGGEGGISS